MDYFKTKLKNEELAEGGRCSHLRKFEEKFQIAECCITDLPEGLRHSDFPKREFSQKPFLTMLKNTGGILFSPEKAVEEVSHVLKTAF